MYQISRLKDNLAVVTAEMPHMASISLGVWVGIGGRYEPAPLNGISHFIEHMLFKGTRRRTARQISQAVEGIGGYLNAFTSEEISCFYSKARHDRFEELLEVLMDMYLNSAFERVEIEKERGVIKEELAMYLDQPHQHVQELLSETLWPNHALGRTLTGTEKTIGSIGRAELLSYQRANYTSATTLVAAAGNLSHENVVKAVARFARYFASGKRPCFEPVNDDQRAPRLRLLARDNSQTQLAMAFRTCSRHDERRFALRLLNALLGENMSSRLFQALREDHGLAYSIQSSLSSFDDVGSLTISAGLEAVNLPYALKLTARELRRFKEISPGATELRYARDYLIGQIELGLESTENQMMWMGEHMLAYGKILAPSEIKKRIAEVKPAQIRKVARDFFQPERLSLALVSPLKSDTGLLSCLKL